MRLFALAVAVLLASPALAGEKWLGALVSGAGADITNAATATPFKVPLGAKLSLYCTAAGFVCTDQSTACTTSGAGKGFPFAASTAFPTSTNKASTVIDTSGTAAAGGAVIRIVGAAAVTCDVYLRNGNE